MKSSMFAKSNSPRHLFAVACAMIFLLLMGGTRAHAYTVAQVPADGDLWDVWSAFISTGPGPTHPTTTWYIVNTIDGMQVANNFNPGTFGVAYSVGPNGQLVDAKISAGPTTPIFNYYALVISLADGYGGIFHFAVVP